MAVTDFGALVGTRKKVWETTAWKQGTDNAFFYATGMMGSGNEDDTKPIHLVTDLTKTSSGDKCVMQLVAELQGDGIAGDNEVNGNEEQLVNDELEIVVDMFSAAVKSKGRMAEQRVVLRFRSLARNKLAFWLGDKLDEMTFLMASGRAFTLKLDGTTRPASQLPSLAFASSVAAPTSNRIMYQGAATSEATLTTGDKMTWNFLVSAAAKAKRLRLKPIRMNGKDCYCIVMSVEQMRDLKQDTNYQTNVGRAGTRGNANPLFSGEVALIDNLILFEHAKVFNTLGLASASKWGSGGTVDGAQALLLGAQALGFARIGDPAWDEADQNNYGRAPGVAYGRMVGLVKSAYRSIYDSNTTQDFSILALKTAAAQ